MKKQRKAGHNTHFHVTQESNCFSGQTLLCNFRQELSPSGPQLLALQCQAALSDHTQDFSVNYRWCPPSNQPMSMVAPALGSEDESPSRTLRKVQHRHFTRAGPVPTAPGVVRARCPVAGRPRCAFDTHTTHICMLLVSHHGDRQTARHLCIVFLLCPHKHSSI